MLPLSPAALVLSLAAGAPSGAPAQGSRDDPFVPGLRWVDAPVDGEVWIPAGVAFAARGEQVWSAAEGSPARVALSASGASGAPLVLRSDEGLEPVSGSVRVAAGDGPDVLYVSFQRSVPGTEERRTSVRRYDPTAGDSFLPVWEHDAGPGASGTHLLAGDGAAAVLAVHLPAQGRLRVERLAAADGALARHELDATSLRALAVSRGGERVALVADAGLRVLAFEAAGAALLHSEALPAPTRALALASDGRTVAFGRGADVVRLAEGPAGFAPAGVLRGAAGELPLRAALSADGAAVAVGWWDAVTGRAARFELWAGEPLASAASWSQETAGGELQEYPAALSLAPDGARLAGALWGGPDAAELVLLDGPSGRAVLVEDLGGSALAVALSDDGTRVAVAAKDAHANELAATGRVLLFDTGERDLQVLGAPSPGGVLELVLERPGLHEAAFLVGAPSAPVALPGGAGSLAVDLDAPAVLAAADWLAGDRAGLRLAVPPWSGLVGAQLAAQGVSAGVGGHVAFSRAVGRPAILD